MQTGGLEVLRGRVGGYQGGTRGWQGGTRGVLGRVGGGGSNALVATLSHTHRA